MNECQYMGRLVKDPEIRYTSGVDSVAVARYTLAVPRPGKAEPGKQNADFIPVEVWGAGAEFADKWFKKGMRVVVIGSMRSGSYTDKDGRKIFTIVCRARSQEFADSAERGSRPQPVPADGFANIPADSFMNIPDDIEDELPFS